MQNKKIIYFISAVIILAIVIIGGVLSAYNHFFPKAIDPAKYAQVQTDMNLDKMILII
jgi:ABC-type enterochelin transport system permease subunit